VRRDKQRESNDGFDGTWVAHPDLVEVATAEFDRVLGERTNQVDRQRPEVEVTGEQLLDIRVADGQVSEAGLRSNVSIGLLYLDSWLRGNGAAALYNLMEDTATAEISRSQIWQWARHRAAISGGTRVTAELVERVIDEELEKIRQFYGNEQEKMRLDESAALFREVALGEEFVEFLTIPGMHYLDPE
jgi:malate synthase